VRHTRQLELWNLRAHRNGLSLDGVQLEDRVRHTDLNGFSGRVGLFDPTNVGAQFNVKTPAFEAEGTYASKFEGGAYKLWVGWRVSGS